MNIPDLTDAQRKELVSRIYWQRGKLPPRNWQKEWPKIRAVLEERDDHENELGHWSASLDADEEAIEEFCVF